MFVPVISKKNLKFIDETIDSGEFHTIVEFGSGASTKYFINKYQSSTIHLISVENTKKWFDVNIKDILAMAGASKPSIETKKWTIKDYDDFFRTKTTPFTPIIEGASRLENWQKQLKLGPLGKIYFHPKYGRWPFVKKIIDSIEPAILLGVKIGRALGFFSNSYTSLSTTIGRLKFTYKLVPPAIKDQYGESPNREVYVNAGISSIQQKDPGGVLFLIDGGARHFIVNKIVESELNHIGICLFDAHRPEYNAVLDDLDGEFMTGSHDLIDGTVFYDREDPATEMTLEKELWFKRIVR